ncbi:MAG: hypothetical protein V9G23_02985 [Giesbergeria sp.]
MTHISHTTGAPAAALPVQRSAVPVIDYEGSGYKTEFWAGQGRDYEDATERLALGSLLPPTGGALPKSAPALVALPIYIVVTRRSC